MLTVLETVPVWVLSLPFAVEFELNLLARSVLSSSQELLAQLRVPRVWVPDVVLEHVPLRLDPLISVPRVSLSVDVLVPRALVLPPWLSSVPVHVLLNVDPLLVTLDLQARLWVPRVLVVVTVLPRSRLALHLGVLTIA